MIFYNPNTATNEENLRWAWLRAVEWGNWPLFIAQPIAPILFRYYTWWHVIIGILVISWVWCLIRYKFISIILMDLASTFVHLKWPISIIIGILFLREHNYFYAAISGFYIVINWFMIFLVPSVKIGVLQKIIMTAFGYESMDDDIKGKSAKDYLDFGKEYFESGDFENALFNYSKAIKIGANKKTAYYNRALTYKKLNENKSCLEDLKSAAALGHEKARSILEKKGIEYENKG